ncbi:bifunctional riboflavin kinase/FAD synthetase [Bacillus sp. GBSW19]|uniref:bifunctional riboflavin kinase/FAD synthetase n=1 Tax=Bacillus sp. GBSW19 TaxID=2108545 RepID=UPI000D029BEC|nr:bifunctional riboflavin kinase/FAD synthetase [Bacillus sp. GBSW19]PRS61017.1 bifunctional riboflavin kinase/FAD synthetase [Bacillus sp. GBSW19]
MKTIHISHPHTLNQKDQDPSVMALGYFDGVHLGHQKVIDAAKSIARKEGLALAVMTFHPHPSHVLQKAREPKDLITPLEDKIDFIEQLGADYLYIVQFSESFAALSPQEFVDQYLDELNVKHAVAGFDFTFGRFGAGTMETFDEYGKGRITATIVPKLSNQDRKVSSTLIRSALKNGDVEYVSELLGKPYQLRGIVIHGDKRGRTIGFPTANVGLSAEYIIPPTGVYAVRAEVKGKVYDGVCNVGYKPTFYEKRPDQPAIEVNLFDFNEEIYGEPIKLQWFKRIRSEQKFNGIQELTVQISQDKEEAIQFFQDQLRQTKNS